MRRKAQAAMEFLMTYGWAILAAIIVIGILGYYYFSSDVLTPNASLVNPPFYLNAQNANTTGLVLEIKNNGGETYNISQVAVSGCGNADVIPDEVASGSNKVVTITCGSTLTAGSTFKGDITITYRKSGSSVDLTSTGSMTEPVI